MVYFTVKISEQERAALAAMSVAADKNAGRILGELLVAESLRMRINGDKLTELVVPRSIGEATIKLGVDLNREEHDALDEIHQAYELPRSTLIRGLITIAAIEGEQMFEPDQRKRLEKWRTRHRAIREALGDDEE